MKGGCIGKYFIYLLYKIRINEREKKYYEKFKSNQISNENLKKGEAKAKNLGDKKNDFLMLIEC